MTAFLASIGYEHWIVHVLLALPILAMPLILLFPVRFARWIALGVALLELFFGIGLWWAFDPSKPGLQFVTDIPWLGNFGIGYRVGIDGLSVLMVLLAVLMMPPVIFGSWKAIDQKQRGFYALLLALQSGMLGVFVATDLFLFYMFWELLLIPMYFIVGIWGSTNRIYAATKFVIYTFVGSFVMLVAIIWMVWAVGRTTGVYSFAYSNLLQHADLLAPWGGWLFVAFALAFAVKVPLFPFHTWLPDAHTEAPTAGSVDLAVILLKMGTYGFLRFAIPFFPAFALSKTVGTVMAILAVVGIIYAALVAMVQPDLKRLIAYSSVSHLGFVMLGIWGSTVISVQGAILVMVSHGISTGALFFMIGMLYERRHTRKISDFGGLARVAPLLATAFMITTLSSIGLPGLNGFIGEFLVLLGSFGRYPWLVAFAATVVVFSAAYMLWATQRVFFNRLTNPLNEAIGDLSLRECLVLGPLIVTMFWIGLYPAPFLRRTEGAARSYIETVAPHLPPPVMAEPQGGGSATVMGIDLSTPGGATLALLPELVLTAWALVVLLVVAWRHRTVQDLRRVGLLSIIGYVLAVAATGWLAWRGAHPEGLTLMIALDGFRFASDALLLWIAGAVALLSLRWLDRQGILAPEYYPLLMLATVGMMLLAGAADLITLFLGLEVMSISVYVLAGFDRTRRASAEAALKYFLIGAFASGFLLYGIALVYGATGQFNFELIGAQLASAPPTLMAKLGIAMVLIGFGFKVAAVPFHAWAPDVYEGAPTPITAFMAAGVKAAAFLALARVLAEAFPATVDLWRPVLAGLAILTILIGNVTALQQNSMKRMLAYSAIAHAGYLLLALWAHSDDGTAAVLVYLLAYGVTIVAAFGILASIERAGARTVLLTDLEGLFAVRPFASIGLSICMLSLLGFPGTFGFIGKWYLVSSALRQGQALLPVIAMIGSAISIGYYLPVILAMTLRPTRSRQQHQTIKFPRLARITVAICVLAILVLGVWPNPVLNFATQKAVQLRHSALPVAGR